LSRRRTVPDDPAMGDVRVVSLGHAGLRIDAPGFRMVMDPWRSPQGAFFGSWFQLPDNGHLPDSTWLDVDWVTVSHEHLDHMDGTVLGRLDPAVRVVIPRYPSTVLRDRICQFGVQHVIELDGWQRLALDDRGSWVTVIPEKSPMCHDSAFLVVSEGRSVLHLNDARLTAAQGRRAPSLTSSLSRWPMRPGTRSATSTPPPSYSRSPRTSGPPSSRRSTGS